MKQLLTLLLLSPFLTLIAQDVRVMPLGYTDSAKHFLRTETRSAIYDIDSKRVLADVSGLVSKKEILLNRFLVLEKPTQTEIKLAMVDLETGYISDFNYHVIMEKGGVVYGTDILRYIQYAFDPLARSWNEQKEKIQSGMKINGWEVFLTGATKYHDLVVDKEKKVIKARGSGVGSFKGCGPYLLYFSGTKTLVDTSGNIVKIDKKVLVDKLGCYKALTRYPDFHNVRDEVFKGEEYAKKLIFENKGIIFFGDIGDSWSYKDQSGRYYDLAYTNMIVRAGYIFGRKDEKIYLLDDSIEPVLSTKAEHPTIYNNRYLMVEEGHTFYDLVTGEYMSPKSNEDSYMSKSIMAFKNNGEWNIRRFSDDKRMKLSNKEITHSTDQIIVVTDQQIKSFYDWDGRLLFQGEKKNSSVVTDNIVQVGSKMQKLNVMHLSGEEIVIPNIKDARRINDSYILIPHSLISVLDANKNVLYEINDKISHNKLGIQSIENDRRVFKDFDGNVIPVQDDVFERVAELFSSKQYDDENEIKLVSGVALLDSFLEEHPYDIEAHAYRLSLSMFYLNNSKANHNKILDHLLSLEKEYPGRRDVKFYEILIKGVLSENYLPISILEIEKLLKEKQTTRDLFYNYGDAYFAEEFYGYLLGYLYHLNGEFDHAMELKNTLIKLMEEEGVQVELGSLY